MNKALLHQQAAIEEILDMMRDLIHYQDPRLNSAQEHLDEAKRIMEKTNEFDKPNIKNTMQAPG